MKKSIYRDVIGVVVVRQRLFVNKYVVNDKSQFFSKGIYTSNVSTKIHFPIMMKYDEKNVTLEMKV